jgi:2-polyprenyl-6-methoxyphenol hydroxylase-like FAD-dependent oxidoreductase
MKVLIAGGGIGGLVLALGFTDLDAVITPAELADIANRYKQLAGFDRDRLNRSGDAPAR